MAQGVFDLAEIATRAIRIIHTAECAARKKFWIGGVPTSQDLHAVAVHVAAQLKTTPEAVKAAVADQN
jgi:hypothetical protein